jgi:hypothetical protein
MSVVIKNLTSRPLIVPLNSGTNLRLSPGEVSDDIEDVEVKANSKTEKLLRQRAIVVGPRAEVAGTEGGAEDTTRAEGDAQPRSRKKER